MHIYVVLLRLMKLQVKHPIGKKLVEDYTITSWREEYNSEDLDKIKKQLKISGK